MKHFYKLIGLIIIFGISLFFFSKNIPNISRGTTTATSLQDSTFPILYLQVEKQLVNTLHGYSSQLDSGKVRESITPLGTDKAFTVKISENESSVKKMDYELKDIANERILASESISVFSQEENYKTAAINLDAAMDTSTEYGFQMMLTTSSGKKIYFYTRIKYYESDFYLKEKLNFTENFHEATFDNGKTMDIEPYLEPGSSEDKTLSEVTIHSSYKLVTWGKLKPKKISECIPTIKELNIETAAIEQVYFVSAETASGTEIYQIKEFYRVRYTSDRIYLLYFQRKMEALFNPELTSLTKSEFKIGITNATDLDITSSESEEKVAFVRNGSLWYYDLTKNQLNEVFTFEQKENDYLRSYYDQHNIRILKIADDGTLSFVVYGYMNSGDYEGRVGILLYDYNPENHQIIERVYIPLSTTYQQLKEDFGDFCYVNKKNVFYFSLNDVVYAYNITSRRCNILTKNASSDNFAMLEKARCFVWSNGTSTTQASQITILDLESELEITVNSKENQSIKVLGTIDENVVYGFIRNEDIYESTDGKEVTPVYQMVISDCQGNILKKYQEKNIYISDVTVDDNVIRMKRLKKVRGKFRKTSEDSVQNQKNTKKQAIDLTTRITDKTLTETYITLPAGFIMEKLPSVESTKYVMVTDNTTLHLTEEKNTSVKYYVYAFGEITDSLDNAGDAIRLADEQMGVVMDSNSNIVWERGGKFYSKQISSFRTTRARDGISSIRACIHMMLQTAQVTTPVSKIKGNSIMSTLRKYLNTPVNLTGCTVDEILYFVSKENPVIAITNGNHAVLITAYTETTVTWLDPVTGGKTTMSLSNAESYFKASDYVFISYIYD